MSPGDWPLVTWESPGGFALVLVPALLALLGRRLEAATAAYAEPALLPWVRRDRPGGWNGVLSRRTAWWLAWLLAALAAAGPRVPALGTPGSTAAGHDLLVVLDVSRSMAAADVAPSRAHAARAKLTLLSQRLRPGDRLGLVLYAGRAHEFLPLTRDHPLVRAQLALVERIPLPTSGSDPAAALALAAEILERTGRAGRSILLLSDGGGWEEAPDDLAAILARLGQAAVPVYALGVGGAVPAPIPAPSTGWALTASGRPAASRLEAEPLRRLAEATGGVYTALTADRGDLEILYRAGLGRAGTAPRDESGAWHPLYPVALVPALVLFFLALAPAGRAAPALLLALGAGLGAGPADAAGPTERSAYGAYAAGDHDRAVELYAALPGYAGRLGEGSSAYWQGDYERAVRAFGSAVLAAERDSDRARALFNLGNAYFRLGDYGTAARVYAEVALYRPEDPAAATNRALAEALATSVAALARQHAATAASREGRGVGPGRRSDMLDRAEAHLTLGDAQDPALDPLPLPELPDTGAAGTRELLRRGLARLQAEGGPDASAGPPDPAYARAPTAPEDVRLADPADLWRRSFEMAEGFPAPLREPRPIPGRSPW